MDKHRTEIETALKECFVEAIRNEGFKGSFPHFRRAVGNTLQLITFQFFSSGGSFVVELGQCDSGGFTTSWGKHIPPNKARATDVWPRLRLGSNPANNQDDHWYSFGPRSYEPSQQVKSKSHYCNIAKQVLDDFGSQAESWWENGT